MTDATYAVTCPHCQREFEGELLEGSAERHRGFKCPHCKLFVPLRRTEADEGDHASVAAPVHSA
jgi:DNA-directed RNA polymerase subunit RPC12/RpoP